METIDREGIQGTKRCQTGRAELARSLITKNLTGIDFSRLDLSGFERRTCINQATAR